MTSYLDNGYDVMKYFAKFEKFVFNSIIIPSQMPELDRGLFLPSPPYKIGCQNTPYKLGLRETFHLLSMFCHILFHQVPSILSSLVIVLFAHYFLREIVYKDFHVILFLHRVFISKAETTTWRAA